MISTGTFRRLAIVNLVAAVLVVTAWHTVRVATESPAPTIKIRWVDTLIPDERLALEERFQLVNSEQISAHGWNYDLIDSRRDVIKAIVEHPAVADTGDLDAVRFTVSVVTDPGSAKRWVWHRYATERNARRTARLLHGWLLLSALAVMWRARRDRGQRSDAP